MWIYLHIWSPVWRVYVVLVDEFVMGLGLIPLWLGWFPTDLADFTPIFYGMKRARVGAFTDFGGSRYRNPVHFLGYFPIFTLILGFSGLV